MHLICFILEDIQLSINREELGGNVGHCNSNCNIIYIYIEDNLYANNVHNLSYAGQQWAAILHSTSKSSKM
jgi:hypothetical protein